MSAKKTSNQSRSTVKGAKLKPRNPVSLNPLMKKSHAHTQNPKAKRAQDKQALKKELKQVDESG